MTNIGLKNVKFGEFFVEKWKKIGQFWWKTLVKEKNQRCRRKFFEKHLFLSRRCSVNYNFCRKKWKILDLFGEKIGNFGHFWRKIIMGDHNDFWKKCSNNLGKNIRGTLMIGDFFRFWHGGTSGSRNVCRFNFKNL